MKIRSVTGRWINKNIEARRVDWDAPSRSKLQKLVKDCLRDLWDLHVVYEEFPVLGTKYTIDFVNATRSVAIEVQGAQHNRYNPHFHGNNPFNFGEQLMRDKVKRDFCEANNFNLIEIFEEERNKITTEFIEKLLYDE